MKRCDGCTTPVTCEMHGCADPSSHPPTRNTLRDAERYRWLRERLAIEDIDRIEREFFGTPEEIESVKADIAIDAAMSPNVE